MQVEYLVTADYVGLDVARKPIVVGIFSSIQLNRVPDMCNLGILCYVAQAPDNTVNGTIALSGATGSVSLTLPITAAAHPPDSEGHTVGGFLIAMMTVPLFSAGSLTLELSMEDGTRYTRDIPVLAPKEAS